MSKATAAKDDIVRDVPQTDKAIALAVAVIQDRIGQLPDIDRSELFDLLLELPKAESQEERDSIWTALEEILAQKPVTAKKLALNGKAIQGKAKKWADHVGRRIRAIRNDRGWTQTELAKKAGLPQSHISRIEKAEYTATYRTLAKIAKAFGIDVGQIDPAAPDE